MFKPNANLLLVLAVVCLVAALVVRETAATPRTPVGTPAAAPATTTAQATAPSPSTPTATPPPPAPTPAEVVPPAAPGFTITKLAPGERPPQFVLFSFDGAGSIEKWAAFSATAKRTNSTFTGFLSGVYLLPDAAKTHYTGPGHKQGQSSIGFGGTPQEVAALVGALNAAKAAGHEIGTHYNGHFCQGAGPSGDDWSAAQWDSEITQFYRFLSDYQALGNVPGPALTVTKDDIHGGRTPCLEGDLDVFLPVVAKHGMTYDTSKSRDGMVWPTKEHGVWEFWMPRVRVPALNKLAIAMDYNFWVRFNNAKNEPAKAPQFRQMVLDTYRSMYEASYAGSRPPLVIGNHFNNWSGNAFNPAAEEFMSEVCGKPETVCTTHETVVRWMEAQDPAVLADLIESAPVKN